MIVIFLTYGRMLPERKEKGAKKLLVDDKIKNTACVKEICLVGVVCKVSNRKTSGVSKHFAFPNNVCYQY